MAITYGRTEYGDISPRTAAYAAKEMLAHAEPVLVLQKLGQTKPHPKNRTQTVKFRRPVPFDAATTPLVEGVTPSAQQMKYEDVEVTLKQYGAVIEITDVVEDTHEDPVIQNAAQLAGEQAAATLEQITYGVVKAGTNVHYANGAARNQVNTAISLNLQRRITRALKAQKAQKITRILDPSPAYETRAIEAAYVAVGHTDLEHDIRGMTGFVPTAEYGSRKVISDHEIGAVEDVRYILSPDLDSWAGAGSATLNGMVSTGGSNVDVYPIIYFGRESFGCVPLKGASAIKPTVINPGRVDKSDPLGQRGYIGWKTYFACVILNENWMARGEVGATDL